MADEYQHELLGESITCALIQGMQSGQPKPGLDNADSSTIIDVDNTPHASQRSAPWGVTFFRGQRN